MTIQIIAEVIVVVRAKEEGPSRFCPFISCRCGAASSARLASRLVDRRRDLGSYHHPANPAGRKPIAQQQQ